MHTGAKTHTHTRTQGITSANMRIVTVDVDGDAPANFGTGLSPQPEDGEFIAAFTVCAARKLGVCGVVVVCASVLGCES